MVVPPLVRLELLIELRFTCGLVEVVLLLVRLELLKELRSACGVYELLRSIELLLVLRLTLGVAELLLRETAADWLLLVLLPPCERLRPWAEASDAPMIRHPVSAKLIIKYLTEVFIMVLIYIVQQAIKILFVCFLDCNTCAWFNSCHAG